MTHSPVSTASVIKVFESIGVPPHELAVLALGVDFSLEMVPWAQVSLLRDAWVRCHCGEHRVEAFSSLVPIADETLEDLLKKNSDRK